MPCGASFSILAFRRGSRLPEYPGAPVSSFPAAKNQLYDVRCPIGRGVGSELLIPPAGVLQAGFAGQVCKRRWSGFSSRGLGNVVAVVEPGGVVEFIRSRLVDAFINLMSLAQVDEEFAVVQEVELLDGREIQGGSGGATEALVR